MNPSSHLPAKYYSMAKNQRKEPLIMSHSSTSLDSTHNQPMSLTIPNCM